ncbi:MAG: efflux RND transporter permease subunit, partial [Kofleriaceae bacterium]
MLMSSLDAPRNNGVIARLIAGSARNPLITILFIAGLGVWGWLSLRKAPLDAIPDLSDAQVIIFTEWMGRSPDLIEEQITYPISSSLVAAPGVKYVRGQSMFGMSFVYVIFDDGTDIYWARSRVLEYLNQTQKQLPAGVTPTLEHRPVKNHRNHAALATLELAAVATSSFSWITSRLLMTLARR